MSDAVVRAGVRSAGWARDLRVGVLAAARAPGVIDRSLRSLLEDVEDVEDVRDRRACTDPVRSAKIAARTLRLLATLPGARWRNTCLFRSVVECTVRRAHGEQARIVIGVGSAADDIFAHSWVETSEKVDASPELSPLRHARTRAVGR
jgi:hypothetical protein